MGNPRIRALIVAAALAVHAIGAARAAEAVKPTIVLVHGAFLDGSSWSKVTPRLQAAGYKVVAVQNPLTSLADDVAATQRAVDDQDGPVVLVGHSWGGSVITQAGAAAKVRALVYLAATAPGAGQSVADLLAGTAPTPGGTAIKPDEAGFLAMSPADFASDFAQDIPAADAAVLASALAPIAGKAFQERGSLAAWQVKPSWYVVATQDRMMPVDLERRMAAAIHARTVEIAASHAVMLSHPAEVAATIIEAAQAVP